MKNEEAANLRGCDARSRGWRVGIYPVSSGIGNAYGIAHIRCKVLACRSQAPVPRNHLREHGAELQLDRLAGVARLDYICRALQGSRDAHSSGGWEQVAEVGEAICLCQIERTDTLRGGNALASV